MNRSDEFKEIRDIADSVCNEEVTPKQVEQLEYLLLNNKEAQRFYYEYIGMHVHMSSANEPMMEVVRRKMQVEEVIVRPVGSNASTPPPFSPIDYANKTIEEPQRPVNFRSKGSNPLIKIGILSLLIILTIILIFILNSSAENHVAKVINGRLNTQTGKKEGSSYLIPGTYTAEKPTVIQLNTGDELALEKFTRLKIFNNTEVELKQGVMKITQALGNNIDIYTTNFTINSEGSPAAVDIYGNVSSVTAGIETTLIPKRWRPKHFWSFDSEGDRVMDLAGNAYGLQSIGAKRVTGLVGSGAFDFDNSANARVNVGSGGGTAPATGSFSVTDGVTIEALIQPQYNGLTGSQDQIFRKDQSDKDLRMLLSFQNDKGKTYLKPEGDFNESLSFGLYLVGQGYHELKLSLDGNQGRPTLAQLKDGNTHHVVATYDVTSGLKTIYIDGKMLASYQYPAGSKILSGGAGMANIGNSPNNNKGYEAFSGVIDELAFYDFALPPYMIKQHFSFTQKGLNYFGLQPSSSDLPINIRVQLPDHQTVIIDPLTGLPNSIKINTSN